MNSASPLLSLVVFRPVEAGDMNFIFDSWIKTWRESPYSGVVRNCDFYEVTRAAIEDLLARGATIEVAAASHDPTRILGWACTEKVQGGVAAHFVYIKDPWRRRGLASALLKRAAPTYGTKDRRFYTFRTRAAAYFPGWEHAKAIACRK